MKLQSRKNKRAEEKAKLIARKISAVTYDFIESIFYFILNIVETDVVPASSAQERETTVHKSEYQQASVVERGGHINTVVLMVNAVEGANLCENLSRNNKLDPTLSRELYIYTDYIWAGDVNKDLHEVEIISQVMQSESTVSDMPKMDCYWVLVPIPSQTNWGVLKTDVASPLFFKRICENELAISVSKRVSYQRIQDMNVITKD